MHSEKNFRWLVLAVLVAVAVAVLLEAQRIQLSFLLQFYNKM